LHPNRKKDRGHEPATLYRVMKDAIGTELRSRCKPEDELPHALLVLVMQMNDDRRRQQESMTRESMAQAAS
jgi:hypothetical protein